MLKVLIILKYKSSFINNLNAASIEYYANNKIAWDLAELWELSKSERGEKF